MRPYLAVPLFAVAALLCNAALEQRSLGESFPAPQGYVSDYAKLIEPGTAADLAAICADLERRAGVKLRVVTVSSSGERSAGQYGQALLEAWHQAGDPPGLVLVIVAKTQRAGLGRDDALDAVLTNNALSRIFPANLQRMREDFQGGLEHLVFDIATETAHGRGVALNIPLPAAPIAAKPAAKPRTEEDPMLLRILAMPIWIGSRRDPHATLPLGAILLIAALFTSLMSIKGRPAAVVTASGFAIYTVLGALIARPHFPLPPTYLRVALVGGFVALVAYLQWLRIRRQYGLTTTTTDQAPATTASTAADANQGPITREKPGLFS